MAKKPMTVDEVAKKFRVNPMTVYRMVKDGRLKANRIGRSIRITQQQLDECVEESTRKAMEDRKEESPKT